MAIHPLTFKTCFHIRESHLKYIKQQHFLMDPTCIGWQSDQKCGCVGCLLPSRLHYVRLKAIYRLHTVFMLPNDLKMC